MLDKGKDILFYLRDNRNFYSEVLAIFCTFKDNQK
jgi:hypothetical protein